MIPHGHLESSWPVHGVVMHQGNVCAAAGLHPETGGGIFVYGLALETGAVQWQKVLTKSPITLFANDRAKVAPNRILNDVLTSDGSLLSLPGIDFQASDSDAKIQSKVDSPAAPK